MKKTILSIAITLVTVLTGYSQETTKVTFGVRGNCGMCKTTIEGAAKKIEGVETAVWDRENKQIDITYNDKKVNIMDIHTAIANSGYDTDKLKGDDSVYENLPDCCQYDRNMKMSLKDT